MKLIKKLSASVVLIGIILSIGFAGSSFGFTLEPSKYRQIDKTGSVLGKEITKLGIPGVGVGKIIFSAGDLPADDESGYNISENFDYAEAKNQLTARAYYAGQIKELIAYVEKKFPGSAFAQKHTTLVMGEMGYGGTYLVNADTIDLLSERSRAWAGNKYELYPLPSGSFSNANFEYIEDKPAGNYPIEIKVFLKFDSGKTRKVSRWEGDQLITELQPLYFEFLIAYGKCNVVKK